MACCYSLAKLEQQATLEQQPSWSSNQAGAASGVERGAARFFTDVIYDYREASVPPNYMASLTPVGLELARLDQVRTVWNMLPGWHTRQP